MASLWSLISKSLTRAQGRPPAAKATVFRPRVEELEDRVVLSADYYVVPGAAGEQVPVYFHWDSSGAAFKNELALFQMDDTSGTVNGVAPGSANYASTVANRSSTVVFHSGEGAGMARTILLPAGTIIGFVLITNSTQALWQRDLSIPASSGFSVSGNPLNLPGRGAVGWLSTNGGNADGFDPVYSQQLAPGVTRFYYEDLGAGGDRNYTDMVFTVSPSGDRANAIPGVLGQQVLTTFTLDGRGSSLFNELGIFYTTDVHGQINGLFPGDPGYAAAALAGNSITIFSGLDAAGSVRTVSLPSGRFFGFYAIAGGTVSQFLSDGGTNTPGSPLPLAYFSFPEQNPDTLAHFANLGGNYYGFEDGYKGGDLDFNDMIFHYDFGTILGPLFQNVRLANDTGSSDSDKITNDASVTGGITDNSAIVSFQAKIDSGVFQSVLDTLQNNGQFLISDARMKQIAGGTLADGQHTLLLQATDQAGLSTTTSLTFTYDTAVGSTTFVLDRNSDSGTVGDSITNQTSVTLSGKTRAGATVTLLPTNQTTTADSSGDYAFNNVTLAAGVNNFTINVTDLAGNTTTKTLAVTQQNATPTFTQVANQTGSVGGKQNLDMAGFFDDADINNDLVTFNTSKGTITVELFARNGANDNTAISGAPLTATNFLNYIHDGDYNNSIFERSVQNFVLQGGGYQYQGTPPSASLNNIPTDPNVANEFSAQRSNLTGTIAMAKQPGDPNSANSAFFFNLANNSANLDTQNGGFTVFGQVAGDGMTVVNSLAQIPTQDRSPGQGPFDNIPLQDYPQPPAGNFPSDTTPDNYAFINSVQVTRELERLNYTAASDNTSVATVQMIHNHMVITYVGAGTANITVTATDSQGATVQQTFAVTVS